MDVASHAGRSRCCGEAMKSPWKCPECGTTPDKHGKGGNIACQYREGRIGSCEGLICECDGDTRRDHEQTQDDVCENAHCYHCGWGDRMSQEAIDPAKLKGWKKKAWDAGWWPKGKA
jgi:hypothetical protein